MVLINLRRAIKLSIFLTIFFFPLWNLSDAARGYKRNFRNGMSSFFNLLTYVLIFTYSLIYLGVYKLMYEFKSL